MGAMKTLPRYTVLFFIFPIGLVLKYGIPEKRIVSIKDDQSNSGISQRTSSHKSRNFNIVSTVDINVLDLNRTMSASSSRILNSVNENLVDYLDKQERDKFARLEDLPSSNTQHVNCSLLFQNDTNEQKRAAKLKYKPQTELKSLVKNCQLFQSSRKYMLKPGSQVEADFPLAFSIIAYKDMDMVERLLRSIYRPQNYYCIHVDSKSPSRMHEIVKDLSKCYPNVVATSNWLNVTWGTMSVVDVELSCMRALWGFKDWKYLINLTGQEFPLKTIQEIVEILKSFNGYNGIHGSVKWANKNRWGDLRSHPPPYNLTLTKGSLHMAVRRDFVEYVLHSPVSLAFLDWLKDTLVPDETFFSSLNHNPHLGVPGAHYKLDEDGRHHPGVVRFKSWSNNGKFKLPCHGKVKHHLCIFGVGDLPLIASRKELFVNKFHMDYQPATYDCLEERHFERTRTQINKRITGQG